MKDSPNCPKYLEGVAKEGLFLKNEVVFCSANICQYNKELPISLEGEPMTLCKSKGLLKKVELDNPDLEKTENAPYINSGPKFDGKLPNPSYLDFTKQ